MKSINSIILIFIKLLIILYCNIDSVPAILGGLDQPLGELYYHVAILINDQYACGGAILSLKHAISAGQCVLDMSGNFLDVSFKILYGFYDGWAVRSAIKVKYVYTLKEFRERGLVHRSFPHGLESADLSILEVEEYFPFGPQSTLRDLVPPRKVSGRIIKYAKQVANITGYGIDIPMDYNSASNLTNVPHRRNIHADLKYLRVYIEKKGLCKLFYREMKDSHICALSNWPRGFTSTDPMGVCLGDVGGPLVINDEVVGVLQIYVNGCDDRNTPAIYTRVSSYQDFIQATLNGTFLPTMRLGNYTDTHVREIDL